MRTRRPLQAPEAAVTGYERNNRAQLFELLREEHTFEIADLMPCGGRSFVRSEFIGYWTAVATDWTYFRYDAHEIIDSGDIAVPVRRGERSIHGIRLQNEHLFLFKGKDERAVFARRYADTAFGRDLISGHAHRAPFEPYLGDHASLPSVGLTGRPLSAHTGKPSHAPR